MSQDNNGTQAQNTDQEKDYIEHNCNCFACETNQEESTPVKDWLGRSTTLTRGDLVALFIAILLIIISATP